MTTKRPATKMTALLPPLPKKGAATRREALPAAKAATRAKPATDEGEREGYTFRIRKADNEQLRDISYARRVTKQALIDEALGEWLARQPEA